MPPPVPSSANDSVIALVRRHDPDRFLTALFAPADKRDALMTLYAFNHELARAREVVSEPHLALIRLHWWREVVEGTRKRHEVADRLSDAIAAGLLVPDDLLPIIDARELEADPCFETLADWRAWLLAGAGGLAAAAGRLLGATDPEILRPLGAAYGVSGVLRAFRVMSLAGRCLLPLDVLAAHGLTPEEAMAAPDSPAMTAALRDIAGEGRGFLASGARVPPQAAAAALPSVLARRDLARWPVVAHPRGLGDRLAVTWHGLAKRGRF
jgi:phytoene synthase